MDAVISFFALEHVADPRAFVAEVNRLLKPGGTFYFLVPNLFANTADLVVADHVNHFSESSLRRLLADGDFATRTVDDSAHHSAWVVAAEKQDGVVGASESVSNEAAVREMAAYWAQLRRACVRLSKGTSEGAIYGSGFTARSFIPENAVPEAVKCFLDQNPHRQKQHPAEPILAPKALPDSVKTMPGSTPAWPATNWRR